MKHVIKVRDASSAKSETKLRGQGWIFHWDTRESVDHPRCTILSILGRKKGVRACHVTHLQSTVGYKILTN